MAKRKGTSGLPKQRGSQDTGRQSRQRKSRSEREAEIQRYVLIGSILGIGLIVFILVAAVVIQLVITPNQVVVSVNGESINVAQFEEHVRLERALLNDRINNYAALAAAQGIDVNQLTGQEPLRTWLSLIQVSDQLGLKVVNDMVDDKLVRQEAAKLGVTVSADDVEKQIMQELGFNPDELTAPADVTPTPTFTPTVTPTPFVSPTPSPTRAPTATPTLAPTVESTAEATQEVEATESPTPPPTFTPLPPTATQTVDQQLNQFQQVRENYFSSLMDTAKVSRETVYNYFESLAYRSAVAEARAEPGNELLYVNARHILVGTQEEAEDIVAALNAGESFADLAKAKSTDTGSGQKGGELGWASASLYVAPFADAVRDAEIGAIIDPVQSDFGWHVIQVHAREMREVSQTELQNAREQDLSRWLQDQRDAEGVTIDINPIWADHVPDQPAFAPTSG